MSNDRAVARAQRRVKATAPYAVIPCPNRAVGECDGACLVVRSDSRGGRYVRKDDGGVLVLCPTCGGHRFVSPATADRMRRETVALPRSFARYIRQRARWASLLSPSLDGASDR